MVGRIETEGQVLVDQKEAMKLLGCSRSTLFRRIRKSDVIQIHVAGTREVYITLDSIDRYLHRGPQFQLKELEPDKVRKRRRAELKRWFPHIMSKS